MTVVIAIPTGVKIFNWLFTMYRGRVLFTTPMLWFLGFIFNFTLGGMTGVLLSIPAVDFQTHNSLFLIAHFHSVIIGGVLFGFFAAFTYWFPKFMGFSLNEKLGKCAFWCWIIGFTFAFMPLYLLGLMGATRRLDHYDAASGWQPLFIVASAGLVIIVIGVAFQVLQVIVSIKERKKNRDTTGDPWNARTLEWATKSPPPEYNFARIPTVDDHDAWWAMKENPKLKKAYDNQPYVDIHLPKNSPFGVYIAGFIFLFGFAIIWHIIWMILVGFIGALACAIIRLSDNNVEHTISAKDVKRMEHA